MTKFMTSDLPYPKSDKERIVWLEENLAGLRRELTIALEARDKAVAEVKASNEEWKRQANEWRATVADVNVTVKDELRTYIDTHHDRLREYIDERVKFMITLMSSGAAVITGIVVLASFLIR